MEERYIVNKVNDVNEKYTINTVKNAMQILRLFTKNFPEWTLTEISRERGLEISHTKRLINTLTNYGYLEKNPVTKKYSLSLAIVRLSGVLTTTMDIYNEARPILSKLVEKFGENVHLGVLEELNVLYLDKFESLYSSRLATHVGKRNPAYCTGCGKVLLAFKPEYEQQELLKKISYQGFEQFASKTIQTVEDLKKDLDIIAKNGYAISIDEIEDGFTSIAVPILDFSEKVIAAISITGSSDKIKISPHLNDLIKCSEQISEKLGYLLKVER